ALRAQVNISNLYKIIPRLGGFRNDEGHWVIPEENLMRYIEDRKMRAQEVLRPAVAPPETRSVYRREIRPMRGAEFLSRTGLFLRMDFYTPREAAGTAVAEFAVEMDIEYDGDQFYPKAITLKIDGCRLHHQGNRFWVLLPEGATILRPDHWSTVESF